MPWIEAITPPAPPVPAVVPSPGNDTLPVWVNYLDLNDIKSWIQIPSSVTADDEKLQDILDMSCWWVQDYLGRPVAPTEFFRRFSGWSGWTGAYIQLPYYPVLSMERVVEYRGTAGPFTLSEQTPSSQVGNQEVYQLMPLTGTVIRTFMGLVQRPWFPGSRNVEITWTAGYNPLPPSIKMATRELAQFWWRNTQEAVRVQRPMEDYDAVGPRDLFPAIPNRVMSLLETYLQQGMG